MTAPASRALPVSDGACIPARRTSVFLVSFTFCLMLTGCAIDLESPGPSMQPVPGGIIRVEQLSYWPRWVLWTLFWWQDLEERFPLENGISLHRVTYWSEGTTGTLLPASGLLALPAGTQRWKGTVSWQHGTATLKTDAPSAPSLYNGVLAAAIFAGAGYVLVAPDYPGFGASPEPHAYYHSASITESMINLLKATRTILAVQPLQGSRHLFLTGFSQGGHATLAAHQQLERTSIEGYDLTGSASIAGPMNLAEVQLRYALEGKAKFGSLYIAWIALCYARVYDQPINDVLLAPWDDIVSSLFDGTRDGAEIVATLPTSPTSLLTEKVKAAIRLDGSHWFVDRLHDNSVVDWTVKTPLRAYYADKDVDVIPKDVITFRKSSQATASGAISV